MTIPEAKRTARIIEWRQLIYERQQSGQSVKAWYLQNGIRENCYYSLMEKAKANSLRLDDYLLHLLSILPERAERNKDFEVDDLLPWSEEMKSWFSAV